MRVSKLFALALSCFLAQAADVGHLTVGMPAYTYGSNVSQAVQTFLIDASNERVGWTFQCKEAMTIDTLGFMYGVRTGTPPTYRVSLQALNTSGDPDGTVLGGGSPASATFTPPADATWDGTWRTVALSNSYACTRGQFLGYVIDYSSGTIDASNNSTFGYQFQSLNDRVGFPVGSTYNGTSWSRSSSLPVFAYLAGTNYGGLPTTGVVTTTISTASEQAMSFNFPTTLWSTYKISGGDCVITTPAAAKSIKVLLYNGTTVLQTATVDSDIMQTASSAIRNFVFRFEDTTLSTLNAGTTYRIGFSPQTGSDGFSLNQLGMPSADARTAYAGGTIFGFSTRTGCGAPCDTTGTAWTDDNTKRALCRLVLSDITAPTAGGGTRAYPVGN